MLPIAVLVAFTAIEAFFFDVFRKPHRILYLYLLVRLLFPKVLEIQFGDGEPIFLWRAAEALQFVLLVAVVAVHYRKIRVRLAAIPAIRNFFVAFVATFFVSVLVPLLLEVSGIRQRGLDLSLLREMFLATHYLYAIVIFLAAIMFLDSATKIRGLLKCLLACGIVGLIDFFLFYVFDLAPTIREATSGASGGYGGLMLAGPDTLGRVAVFAILAAFGLGKLARSASYYVLGLLFFVLVLAAASRPVLVSLVVAVAAFLYMARERSQRGARSGGLLFIPLAPVAAVLLLVFIPWGVMAFQAERNVTRSVVEMTQREDFFEADVGVLQRVAFWYRAADVFVETFPFGTGGGMLPYYMAPTKGSTVDSHFEGVLPGSELAERMYEQTMTERFTSVHNLYIEFIVENGLGGLILCGWFGWLVFRAYRRLMDKSRPLTRQTNYLLATTLAMLLAASLNVMTDATVKIFWFYAVLLYVVTFLATPTSETSAGPAATTPVASTT